MQFDTAWDFPFPIFEKLASDFPTLDFQGSAYEPNCDIYIKFVAGDGEFAWEDDDDARKADAATFDDEEASAEVTA